MDNIELYKKYRPKTWGGLLGQTKVAASLKNAVLTDRIPTAFLFCGPRGCGKTTAAFILTKAINCEDQKENGNPCNVCDTCVAIDENRQSGVNYISMANKGSADDVRSIVQQARLTQPVNRQVWILDEVHNLSKQAFDSLLIPLEEKTMPALFILCSTEIERIPETVLSRVQQRRFDLVSPETLKPYLKKIIEKEEFDLTDEDCDAAIRQGRGSVRDTLTALDSIVATGETSPTFGGQLLEALTLRDLTKVYSVIAEANNQSVNFRDFTEQLFEDLRDLLLLSNGIDEEYINVLPISDPQKTITQLGKTRGIMILMNEVGNAITQMSSGADSRIILEIALLRGTLSINKLFKLMQK